MIKRMNLLFIFMLILQMVSSSLFFPQQISAEGSKQSIFTHTSKEADGENVKLKLDWSVSGLDAEDGDTYTYTIPAELEIKEVQSGSLDGEVGTYKASTDGKVEVTFNNAIEEQNEASGTIVVAAVDENEDTKSDEETGEESEDQESQEGSDDEQDSDGQQGTDEPKSGNDGDNEETNTDEDKDSSNNEDEESSNEDGGDEDEEKRDPKQIKENIITGVTLSVKEGDSGEYKQQEPGTEIVVENPYNKFKVKLDYTFTLPNNHKYGDGSTFTIDIPNVFSVLANPEPTPLANSSGIEFASFIVTSDNKIVITFNKEIEENSNVSGFINLESEFDAHYAGPAEGEVITFPIAGEDSIEFPIKFIPRAYSIDKKGVPKTTYNTEKITWTVDFNKDLQEIDNATIRDVATEGDHTLVEDSFKVYKLYMNADGTIQESRTEFLGDNYFGSTFPLEMGEIDSAYRIVYETKVNDNKGTSYKNEATLDGDNVEPVKANATVTVKRGQPLEKKSIDYDAINQTITWEVKYNYDEKIISKEDAKLTDIFGNNQELIKDSFKVEEISINPDTGKESGSKEFNNFHVNDLDDGFEFVFDEDISKAYKITYQTKAKDRVDSDESVSNTIRDEFENEKSGTQRVNQGIFIKTHVDSETNYENKVTGWKLRLNTDQYEMKNVVITDTLPKGFTLDEESLEIKHGGETIDGYSLDYDGGQSFTIKFNDDVTKEVIVTFRTMIDFDKTDKQSSFTNRAHMEWNYKDGPKLEKEDSATFTPDDYTQANGFKGATYNVETKEITWEIGVNYNNATLKNATVEDFILGDQNFYLQDVKVYRMTLTGGVNGVDVGEELSKDEYKIEKTTNEAGKEGFKISLGNITTPYKIVYKTDLNNLLVDKNYNNTATVSSDNQDRFELKASISPYHGGEYTKKSASQNAENPRIVNWRVNINYTQSTVDDVSITDTLSKNQMLLPDSIKLYETNVTPDGISKGKKLTEGEDYTLEIGENEDEEETFTISFIEKTIDRAYVLEYDTRIMFKDDGFIKNKVKFNGLQTEGIDTGDTVHQQIQLGNIGGGIDGNVGSLEVIKVDADDQKPLEGATFELYDEDGKLVTSKTTDESGKVLFTKLLYKDYTLKETRAPKGYAVGIKDERKVTINDSKVTEQVENKTLKHAIKLIKQNSNHPVEDQKLLKGAEFTLYHENGNVVVKYGENLEGLTTNEDGEIVVNELDPGKYYFIETKAPKGYQLNDEKHHFTIENDQTEVKELIVENKPIAVTLIKIRSGYPNVKLKGAEFKLYKKDDDTPITHRVKDNDGNDIETDVFITNDEGEIIIEELAAGEYYFVETKAPAGYRLNPTPVEFTVIDGKPNFIMIENTRRPSGGGGTPPPTDPEEPGEPDPTDPNEPGEPGEPDPTDPNEPGEPGEPDPTDPNKPGEPGEPDPTDPNEPGEPSDPDPTDPNEPGEPSDPDPTEPNKPGEPGEPDPTDPNKPGKPSESDPNKPGKPSEPNDPNDPKDPAKPGEPNDPTDSGKQGDTGKSSDKLDDASKTGLLLPNTATNIFNYALIGVLILGAGLLLLRQSRKREQ